LLSGVNLGPEVQWPLSQSGTAVADFNRDGLPDIASDGGVALGAGGGTFQAPIPLQFTAPAAPFTLFEGGGASVAADFNGDGIEDLAMPVRWTSTTSEKKEDFIQLWLGNGDGSMSAHSTVPIPHTTDFSGLLVGDFNADHLQDLVFSVSANVAQGIDMVAGDGTGQLGAPTSVVSGVEALGFAAGDFNSDGATDVVFGVFGPGAGTQWVKNNGDGTFGAPIPIAGLGAGQAIQGVSVGDFNGDGKPDVATLTVVTGGPSGSVPADIQIHLGSGTGFFGSAPDVLVPGDFFAYMQLDSGDLTGDGLSDLVLASDSLNGTNTAYVVPATGDGGFAIPVPVGGPSRDHSVVTDLSGDGVPDLALVDGLGSVGILLNHNSFLSPPAISIGDASLTEGDTGAKSFNFTVTRSGDTSGVSSVNYATSDGTATVADSDYQTAAGTVTFATGETSKVVTVLVNGDTTFETDETFLVKLTGVAHATLTNMQATGTILNDDAQPAISIKNVSVNPGTSGTTNAVFAVSLSNPSYQAITVHYATADGTATAGTNDYLATSGTLTFMPGQTSQSINIPVSGTTAIKPNLNFLVNLTSPANASVSISQGVGTILNSNGPRITSTGRKLAADKKRNFTGVVASFTDPDFGTATSFSAVINWGDGTSSDGSIVWDTTTRAWDVIGTHPYSKKGTYSMLVVIKDLNGATSTAKSTMTV